MTSTHTRIERIRQRLQAALQPNTLDIIDDSHKHIGHPGAQSGLGHFTIIISAEAFREKTPLAMHRQVYAALGGLMQTDIHAVKIVATVPAAPPSAQDA